jgi:allantoate deiminase
MRDLASIVIERIDALGKMSDEPGRLTRTFGSSAMHRANDLVASWMRKAGMETRLDAIGNLIGRFESPKSIRRRQKHFGGQEVQDPKSKVLLLGSHLDTVCDAGKFDGPLGVLIAIACVQYLNDSGVDLPFAIEVVAFCDEEGVRYQSTYLGSRVLAGTFDRKDLKRLDANGISMVDAIREFGGNPHAFDSAKAEKKNLLGYVEVHIEQGPILEAKNLSVGVVSAISGQSRFKYKFVGKAGHAGTVPMNLRSDALCAAAEFITEVEAYSKKIRGLVATVGTIKALPGASNVISGETSLTLDVRHPDDRVRKSASAKLRNMAGEIARRRGLKVQTDCVHEAISVSCDRKASALLERLSRIHQGRSILLPSGAGHDAAAIAAITSVAMLFVRCKGGISHHPDEFASEKDILVALKILVAFVTGVARKR